MDSYIFRYVSRHGRLDKLREAVSSHEFPLLVREKALRMKLNTLDLRSRVSLGTTVDDGTPPPPPPTLVHLKAVDLFTSPSEGGDAVRRATVASAECFPHLGTDPYIRCS